MLVRTNDRLDPGARVPVDLLGSRSPSSASLPAAASMQQQPAVGAHGGDGPSDKQRRRREMDTRTSSTALCPAGRASTSPAASIHYDKGLLLLPLACP